MVALVALQASTGKLKGSVTTLRKCPRIAWLPLPARVLFKNDVAIVVDDEPACCRGSAICAWAIPGPFLAKPFLPETLIAAVARLLPPPEHVSAEPQRQRTA
jgi:hypothetical protein